MAAIFDSNNPPNIPSLQRGLEDQFVKKPKGSSANWMDELSIRLGETKQEKIDELRRTNPALAKNLEDLKRAYAPEIEEREKRREKIASDPIIPTFIKQEILQREGLAIPEDDLEVPSIIVAPADDESYFEGHCFPECSNSAITAQLNSLIPKLTIKKYNTGTFPELFQRFINGIDSLSMNSFSSGDESGINDSTLDNVHSKLIGSSASNGYPKSISLLFESLPHTFDCEIVLPITSTPLSINGQLDHGWKTNQSIFEFIKKQIGGNSPLSNLIGTLFGDFGKSILNTANAGTAITENLMHIFGSDIQLGPYWSLGEGALDNRQTLTFNTILVNDSDKHYESNSKILKKLFVKSLPMAMGGFKINPPSIFDIKLNTCVAGLKEYFLCAGQFSCEAKGRYYGKNKIPEAYSLSLTFNSLIPDLLAIQPYG